MPDVEEVTSGESSAYHGRLDICYVSTTTVTRYTYEFNPVVVGTILYVADVLIVQTFHDTPLVMMS